MATALHEPRWLSATELEPGLALRLSPDELLRRGASPGNGPNGPVIGWHHFLCVSVRGGCGLWLPLFSRLLPGRQGLSKFGRTGTPVWTAGSWHYQVRQVWNVPNTAIVSAAAAARDESTPHRRNRLRPSALPMPWRVQQGGA